MKATRKRYMGTPMVLSDSSRKSQSVVHYCFIPTASGVTMELWEPRFSMSRFEPPYQFRLRRQFLSEREALIALQQYLAVNSGTTAIADWIGHENGKLSEMNNIPTTLG
ncbi:MAG: hypothetical protein F6K42_31075 [Leptolyngbya sp. SIO1D8]|nr:hypothetical protein [Leptolyngbya sp. SIO1D8]